jgi:adenine deaminase
MLIPSEFARAAVAHGTVSTVSDPHEIGNVLGKAGVEFMLHNAATVPFKFCFGAPSCVPATKYETSGAEITVEDVRDLLNDARIGYLSEVMNFPGVLNGDPMVMAKIAAAKNVGKPIDGHAPGLHGELAKNYFSAGITTDHECFTKPEALDKLAVGCKIAIREGSAARNFEALYELIDEYPDQVMLCSDDKHPDELIFGHINRLAARAIKHGMNIFNVIKASSLNAIQHYGLNVGRLQVGDPADFVELADLTNFRVLRTFVDGMLVAERGTSFIQTHRVHPVNHFDALPCTIESLMLPAASDNMEIIRALDGQLVTQRVTVPVDKHHGHAVADPRADVLKLVVLNRYKPAKPAIAFIQGFGLKRGAIASSVAHDSHNIIAVGVDDDSLCQAINQVVAMQGGLAVAHGDTMLDLPLPVAGLMSLEPIEWVSERYAKLDNEVKEMGSHLRAPFMTLSFMALLVIPDLKLSDLGLFDGQHFRFTEMFV